MLALSDPPVIDRRLEKALVVILLLFLSGGIIQKRLVNIPITLIQVSALLLAAVVLRRQLMNFVALAFRDFPLVIVTAIAVLSVFWSVSPAVTFEHSLWLVFTGLFGVYIASRFSLEEQLELVLWMMVLAAISSLVVAQLAPEIGIHPPPTHGGQWRGVFLQKNILSRYMALGAILALYYGKSLGWLRWPMFGLMTFLLFLSGGATGILALIVLAFTIPLYQIIRFRHMVAVGVFLISVPFLVAGSTWLSSNYDNILRALNRDETLTGRTDLWSAGFAVMGEQPLFGHGFRASFQEGSEILDLIEWRSAPFAHNQWIDTGLDLGVLTLAIFAFGFFRSIWKSLIYARHAPTRFGLFPFVFLIFLLIVTMSTQSLIAMFDVLWIMYVAITISLSNVRFSETAYALNSPWQNRNYQQLYNVKS
jgi:exopolysaccharide production protein ExoQ